MVTPRHSPSTTRRVLPLLVAVLFAAWTACHVVHVAMAKTRHRSLLVKNAKPHEKSVFQRGIVTEHMSYRTVLFEHSRHWENTSHRHFKGKVLGYVTPWNSKGYDVALKFRQKFTHVSPVWYQLKGLKSGPELGGKDGVNVGWKTELKSGGDSVKLVPRVNIEGSHVKEMMKEEEFQERAVSLIVAECLSQGYDGIVLEAWSAWLASGVLDKQSLRQKALSFVKRLAQALQEQETPLETILVIAPPGSDGQHSHVFSSNDLVDLAPHLSGFSLMTYDFSNPHNAGPNSPINWIQACLSYLLPHVRAKKIQPYASEHHYSRELRSLSDGEEGEGKEGDEIASKVLLGLNFYGNKFEKPQGGGPIVGHEYLDIVDKHRPSIHWDESSKEHHFEVKSNTGIKYEVYYPTLKSIAERLDEARAWGTGVSIWEIGQGLDFFYDLL